MTGFFFFLVVVVNSFSSARHDNLIIFVCPARRLSFARNNFRPPLYAVPSWFFAVTGDRCWRSFRAEISKWKGTIHSSSSPLGGDALVVAGAKGQNTSSFSRRTHGVGMSASPPPGKTGFARKVRPSLPSLRLLLLT